MVERVVMGVSRRALAGVEMLPVIVPRLDIPAETADMHLRRGRGAGVTSTYLAPPLPVVALTTSVVTGLEPVAPGDSSLTPPTGTVLRIVPAEPGAPFRTTWTHKHT